MAKDEQKPQKAQKFYTIIPRYVNGKYVVASPEYPALVEFPARLKIKMQEDGRTPVDGTLLPYEQGEPLEIDKQEKPFSEIRRGPPDRKAHDRDLAPGQRPSDSDPAGG